MRLVVVFTLAAGLVVSFPLTARAAPTVTFERNQGSQATGAFQFKTVPSPSKTDAAAGATFIVLDGQADANAGELAVLHDGLLPSEDDQPEANFFFDAGTSGGRIVIDLGQASEIRQVNTYSWHRDLRGPQVYRLWAADGQGKDFTDKPGPRVDLRKAGWTFLASVDTRPARGLGGGQYGASVSDPAAGKLGTYRYLLLEVYLTTEHRFGNTFFSEIDVIDGKEHAPASAPATQPAYEIVFDASETPDLKDWGETRLKPICEKWYPMIVQMLPSEGFTAPRRLTVLFKKGMGGVAFTAGRNIVCAEPWFKQNLDGEAAGAVVHELVHVVQQYRRVRGGQQNPGWLVEGVADYIRWFLYEPAKLRPRVNPDRAKYTDSYRTTGAFINYLVESVDKDIVTKLNTAMRQGKYTPELWKTCTGKTVDELWADYVQTLKKK